MKKININPIEREVDYIVLHTAAHGNKENNYDTSAEQINDWHLERGWRGIGYHFVIRHNGDIEEGRELERTGAHAKGLNTDSIGICMSGHGDYFDFTEEQYESLFELCIELSNKLNVPIDNIIGHRELNDLIEKGHLESQYKTYKTCPGKIISMDMIRKKIKEKIKKDNKKSKAYFLLSMFKGFGSIFDQLFKSNLIF